METKEIRCKLCGELEDKCHGLIPDQKGKRVYSLMCRNCGYASINGILSEDEVIAYNMWNNTMEQTFLSNVVYN